MIIDEQAIDQAIIVEQRAAQERKEFFRKAMLAFEEKLRKVPGVLVGHEADESELPIKHTFVDGAYVREMFAPKGYVISTKIHKVTHPYFVLKGECEVLTEDGLKRIKAPFYGVTPAGTKRLVYIYEDVTWVTVHVTNETDIEKIEEQIIAKSFDDPDLIANEKKNFLKGE